jgi:hypothetical protein
MTGLYFLICGDWLFRLLSLLVNRYFLFTFFVKKKITKKSQVRLARLFGRARPAEAIWTGQLRIQPVDGEWLC